jgi:hypothetical protein
MNRFKVKLIILQILTVGFMGLGVWFGLKFQVWQSVMMFMLCSSTNFDAKYTVLEQRIRDLEDEKVESN